MPRSTKTKREVTSKTRSPPSQTKGVAEDEKWEGREERGEGGEGREGGGRRVVEGVGWRREAMFGDTMLVAFNLMRWGGEGASPKGDADLGECGSDISPTPLLLEDTKGLVGVCDACAKPFLLLSFTTPLPPPPPPPTPGRAALIGGGAGVLACACACARAYALVPDCTACSAGSDGKAVTSWLKH